MIYIYIIDIAHALSLMTRGNCHIKYFYSVAQHSINCFKEAKKRNYSLKVQLATLLHDASEGYLSDITRPVKRKLPEYRKIESHLQKLIYIKYLNSELTKEESELVNDVDDAILQYELEQLLDTKRKSASSLKNEPDLRFKNMQEVEKDFLDIFYELTSKLNS